MQLGKGLGQTNIHAYVNGKFQTHRVVQVGYGVTIYSPHMQCTRLNSNKGTSRNWKKTIVHEQGRIYIENMAIY
jgi:hypothetical protein